jgi:hypothetical protein
VSLPRRSAKQLSLPRRSAKREGGGTPACTILLTAGYMLQHDVTAWLLAWGQGNADANDRLVEAVYADLRRSPAGASGPSARITR